MTDLSGMTRYRRLSYGRRNGQCRLTLRRKGTELCVLMTEEILAEIKTAIGDPVAVYFDERKIVIVPDDDGEFRIRRQQSEGGHVSCNTNSLMGN